MADSEGPLTFRSLPRKKGDFQAPVPQGEVVGGENLTSPPPGEHIALAHTQACWGRCTA